jgi:DtxR family manganese transport transcriptional regulator
MGNPPRPAHPRKLRKPTRTAAERLPAASIQAASHARTRKAHANELAEDYVEIVADLIAATGEARVVDIAQRLGVSHVTVVRTLARLQKLGLVTTRPYRSIFLTDEGARLAEASHRRHEIVVAFLLSLGIPPAIAHPDAEGIEHHVSPQTLAAFEKHTK